ncbi:MAG: hypothetical protein IJI03_09270, partial [Rudaea sp.]|nr:hypothetical protein [Rudaea sp.]
ARGRKLGVELAETLKPSGQIRTLVAERKDAFALFFQFAAQRGVFLFDAVQIIERRLLFGSELAQLCIAAGASGGVSARTHEQRSDRGADHGSDQCGECPS